jgi:uncharacterized protein (TIGR02453 family)
MRHFLASHDGMNTMNSLFTKNATQFFASLEKNNSKAWFEANRKAFETEVKAPLAMLIESLPEKHKPLKVFRLNRDTRFSADKSPYKLMHGALHTRAGGGIEYLHLDKNGLLLAAGQYMMEPEQLHAFRKKLMDAKHAATFKKMISTLGKNGIVVEPGGAPPLKSAPRGVPPDHPMIEWLRWKGCIAMTKLSANDLISHNDLTKWVTTWWKQAQPLNVWLEG